MSRAAVLMIAAMACGLGRAAVPAAPVRLTLHPYVQAEAGEWSLAEAVDAPDAVRAGLQLDRVRLPAPQAGHVERWRPAQIERLLRTQAAHVLPPLSWDGAEQLLVTRKAQKLAAEELVREAATAWMQARPALRADAIEPCRPVEPVEIGVGTYRLRPRRIERPDRTEAAVWIDVLMQERVVRSVTVGLCNREPQVAYAANRFLRAGEYVTAADFDRVESAGAAPDAYLALAGARDPVRLKNAVRAGETLTMSALEPSGAIRRGDPVRVVSHAGAMTIEVSGTAAGNAQPGEVIAVHWELGRELVRGRLLAGHRVEIE